MLSQTQEPYSSSYALHHAFGAGSVPQPPPGLGGPWKVPLPGIPGASGSAGSAELLALVARELDKALSRGSDGGRLAQGQPFPLPSAGDAAGCGGGAAGAEARPQPLPGPGAPGGDADAGAEAERQQPSAFEPLGVPSWAHPPGLGGYTGDYGAFPPAPPPEEFPECRWHSSANSVGVVSADGHVFTKTGAGGKKVIMSSRGTPVELSAICMVFDSSLRCGGTHRYNYQILDGELGAADGAGFVFDKQVRRNNIQRMRSVFLNQRGRICLRDNGHVSKLRAQLPPLEVGMWLTLHIDLDNLTLQFAVFNPDGVLSGVADVSLMGLLGGTPGNEVPRSGFFCAIVTKDISVGLA